MSYKLFIPGPITVSEKTLRAMAQPMIGHRSTDFVALYNSIQPDLQALIFTKDPVYISTSSAWGSMEGRKQFAKNSQPALTTPLRLSIMKPRAVA